MRASGFVACCLMVLGLRAEGDILKIRLGEEVKGTLHLVTFTVKDVQTIYPRDELVGIQVAREGNDVLEVRDEPKIEGKIVSVMFEAPNGLRSITREKIEAITLDSATTLDTLKTADRESAEKLEEEKSALTPEQKQALLKNRDLYKSYRDAAEATKSEGYEAVKTKYMTRVREVVNDIQRLERTITNKLRRREEASTRTYSTGTRDGRPQMSERERLVRYDGLERDQRDYERAVATANKLKATIRAEEAKVKEKTNERLSRILGCYEDNRKKVLAGQILAEEELTARFEAALRLPGERPTKVITPKTAKTN